VPQPKQAEESSPLSNVQKTLFNAIRKKQAGIDTLYSYYDGNQPLRFTTERLQEAFGEDWVYFAQNWCGVVVDTVLERLQLAGLGSEDERLAGALKTIWAELDIEQVAMDAHQAALVTTEAFLIAWKTNDGLQLFFNEPKMIHVLYDANDPRKKLAAGKMWQDEITERWLMNVYYQDRVVYYRSRGKTANSYSDFEQLNEELNPFKVVPVFSLRPGGARGSGELSRAVMTAQDALNKAISDLMVGSEFASFKQRVVIADAELKKLKNQPGRVWRLPPAAEGRQPTQFGTFEEEDLGNVLRVVEKWADYIAIVSRTPKHYLWGQGANVSGDALMAMEAPLVKKTKRYQKRLTPAWQDVAAFLLELGGVKGVSKEAIVLNWEPAETVQPVARAQTAQSLSTMVSPAVAAGLAGYPPVDVQKVKDDQEERNRMTSSAERELELLRKEDALKAGVAASAGKP
jgi:hypothetical protein